MWKVEITKGAEAELRDLLKEGFISKSDVKVLLKWLDEMEEFGPEYIARSKDWHDHALDGSWRGFRSSAFCKAGRVIYKILGNKIVVEVHRVTSSHNYKRVQR